MGIIRRGECFNVVLGCFVWLNCDNCRLFVRNLDLRISILYVVEKHDVMELCVSHAYVLMWVEEFSQDNTLYSLLVRKVCACLHMSRQFKSYVE